MLHDKDTYRVAFALAGRAEEYRQVPHPPSMPQVDHTRWNVSEVGDVAGSPACRRYQCSRLHARVAFVERMKQQLQW